MKHIAVDLGASNGRVIVADADGLTGSEAWKQAETVDLDVCRRFPSHVLEKDDGIHWDISRIFDEIKAGLKTAFSRYGDEIESMGIDSWGVDFGLVDAGGDLMFAPYHYRDNRTDGVPEQVFREFPARRLFEETGVQIMQLNTVFQLASMNKAGALLREPLRKPGVRYLSIPDLLTYWLTGEMINERTHASTTQLFSPSRENWSDDVLKALDIPRTLFGEITPAGTVIGPLTPALRSELGAPASLQFIASGSHDTQSAAYLAGTKPGRAFLSCGTWSILGMERNRALISDAVFEGDFSNEASAYGGYNLLRNIMGLWILQECKAEWDETGDSTNYSTLVDMAGSASVDGPLLDVNHQDFLGPRQQAGSMVHRINAYLRHLGGVPLNTPAQLTRLIIESLAQSYAADCDRLEKVTGQPLSEILLIGGGARNQLLASLTAEKTGLPVYIGPGEATALGNIMIQRDALDRSG